MKEYIIEQFNNSGINITQGAAEKFCGYYNIITEWNARFNLTAIKDFEDIVLKHFIDSAYGLKYISGRKNLCDVGAGAGFPSIPLKILYPEIFLTMIESVGKKTAFLQEAVKELALENCVCINARAEDAARGELRESFDAVTARAVAPLNTLCEYCLPLTATGGVFIAYKGGADEEFKEAENAVKILGGKIETFEKYELGGSGHARSLIVIKKIKHTDNKYPRTGNKAKLKPL